MKKSDVIVVGAGPAGLSFCRALADSQLNMTLIDPHCADELATASYDGREIALTHPSKEILQQLGIWQKIPEHEIYQLRDAKVVNGCDVRALHFPQPTHNSKKQPIDNLGYFVSNYQIRCAAYAAVSTQENIHWRLEQRVASARCNDDCATVTLTNGETLTADLLIAADSRFSTIRQQIGIAADLHDFARTVIVFRVEHEIPHQQTAYECFFYGNTLALLPLSEHITNCVVTIDTQKLPQFMALTQEEWAETISEQIAHRFGKMRVISELHHYPLMAVHARQFYAPHCALIGDAACGMHPVTAQGFNLGLKSQHILSRLIIQAAEQGKSIAAPQLLKNYNRRHQINTRPLYHGTNHIVHLFTRETRAARFLRRHIVQISDRFSPLKHLISRQLTG